MQVSAQCPFFLYCRWCKQEQNDTCSHSSLPPPLEAQVQQSQAAACLPVRHIQNGLHTCSHGWKIPLVLGSSLMGSNECTSPHGKKGYKSTAEQSTNKWAHDTVSCTFLSPPPCSLCDRHFILKPSVNDFDLWVDARPFPSWDRCAFSSKEVISVLWLRNK